MKKKQKAEPESRRKSSYKGNSRNNSKSGGLTFSEKKRLIQLKHILSGKSIEKEKPTTAQRTITFEKMFRDGICQVSHRYYTKMVEFFDINYELLEVDDQADILAQYSKLINYFDPSVKFELVLFNRQVNEQMLTEQFDIPWQEDDFNDIREEYTEMLKKQAAKGNNGIIKSKYLIFGVESNGYKEAKDGYLEGNEYLVSWCVGHLVELAQPESYEEAWKKWSYESLPIIPQEWQHEVKSDTKAQYQILKKLMHDDRVDAVVCATDAGREGELIFRLTYNMAGCRKPMKRLWISSMEESAIRDGFHNLRPGSDYDNLYHSALCRQEADWLVGINGTRLFTVLYGGKALKVGRVQTPTLAMLVDRESKIMNFKKEAYYMAHIMGNGLDAVSEHISDKTEAERIAGACENGQALVTSVVKEEKWVAPPKLYDLTTLQRDANRLFGFTAKQTLEYTQSLYEKKLVTYPRTDSQYLSDDMEGTAKNVIEAIFNSLLFEQNVMFNPDIKRILNSKKVTDHHAIIPTMEIIKQDLKAIPESEMKILSLCANRLLCATGEKHIYNSTKAEITCNNIVFKVSGKEVWKNGWKEFEDFFKNSYKTAEDKSDTEEEKKLPELCEGMTIAVEQTKVSEHFTQPPKHYTEDLYCKG